MYPLVAKLLIASTYLVSYSFAWSFQDNLGNTWSGSGNKPKILCHVDICESLWHMGVRTDQLVGYFGGDMSDVTQRCHGTLCMTANFNGMTNVNTARYTVDLGTIVTLNPDIIIDQAYCYWGTCDPYKGLLSYSGQMDDLKALGIPMVQINVGGVGYIEVVETIQQIANGISSGINFDVLKNCELSDEMRRFSALAKRMWAENVKVTTASFSASTIYAAEPKDDAILIMLEELGVPMTHVNPNDPRGGYWEYISLNASTGISPISSMYPTDIWLYDARSEHRHLAEADPTSPDHSYNFTDPAWDAGQIAPWPIDTAWTYQHAASILTTLRKTFETSIRVTDKVTCTLRAGESGRDYSVTQFNHSGGEIDLSRPCLC